MRHGEEPLIAEEWDPAVARGIGLRQRPDACIALIAEVRPGRRMQARDQLRGMALDAWRDPTPVILHERHDDKVRRGEVNFGNGQLGLAP